MKKLLFSFIVLTVFLFGCSDKPSNNGARSVVKELYKAGYEGDASTLERLLKHFEGYAGYEEELPEDLYDTVDEVGGIRHLEIDLVKKSEIIPEVIDGLDNAFDRNWRMVSVTMDEDYLMIWILQEIDGEFYVVDGEDYNADEIFIRAQEESEAGEVAHDELEAEVAAEDEGVEQPSSDDAWFGHWVYLDDYIKGNLIIEPIEGNQFNIVLGGSKINPFNNSSYANVVEATGVLDEYNNIFFTSTFDDMCTGTLVMEGDIISVNSTEACHSPKVYFSGEFLKEDSIQPGPLFSMENGAFEIYGVGFGDRPANVKRLLGNAVHEGPDEDGFYEWVLDYEDMLFSIFDNQVDTIVVDSVDVMELKSAIAALNPGDIYISEDQKTVYLYNTTTEQLLSYSLHPEDSSKASVLLTYADGNFQYSVENGWVVKVERLP
ncbi:hypothetical protein [Salirhabdus sp. Marseille-P4669]|uniref:hypothetical protein n=1 Tax=Salirhabdus sp. Marseille-P4669 TaxID=2042310 RepID=UPI000C7A03A7|nr:hypothetical protein [Salirhabdus sp. Marseille-P4669]